MNQFMKAPFLDMVAEREVGEPYKRADMMALSAYQFTQSIPVFHRKFEHKIGLKEMRGASLSSLDLSLTPLREPIPLRKQPKGHSNLNNVQTVEVNTVKNPSEMAGSPQEKPVTAKRPTSSPSPHSQLTPEEIKQGLQKLRDQVATLNSQRRKELPCRLHNSKAGQKPISRILCEITDNIDKIKEPVYIPITTTTGCDHQTSPSAFHQKELYPIETLERLLSHVVIRPGELSYSSPTVGSSRSNSENSHTDLSTSPAQSQSSMEGDEVLVELLADITSMKQEARAMEEERAHLRGGRLLLSETIMPAPENSSLPRSTFTQDQMSIATNQWKLLNIKQMAQELDINKAPSPVEQQTQMVEENPWVYPEEEGSDDIASHSSDWGHLQDTHLEVKLPTEEDYGEWKIVTEWKEYHRQNRRESTGLQFVLYCLKALAKLYWSTVWPMLDPRTLQVEHDGPMPFWKACLLIVLAAPMITVGFVVIVQGMKLVRLMAWLLDYADDGAAIWI
jgi:hypothetical protein